MSNNPYSELVKKYREEMSNPEKAAALSDRELEKVAGGVGGADEATCPKCGKPMTVNHNPYGDDTWYCKDCDLTQLLSDAEFIEMVDVMKMLGYPVELPVWWEKIKR